MKEQEISDFKNWEDCVKSFIRNNQLSRKWEIHCEMWERDVAKLPPSIYDKYPEPEKEL